MKRLFYLFTFGCLLISFTLAGAFAGSPPPRLWIDPPNRPRAVSVVVHGLNLQPERMDSIARILTGSGIKVLRVALTGHRGDREQMKGITRDSWLEELKDVYREARAVADREQLPLYFVGYSLGAALNLDLMNSEPPGQMSYDRMLLLAPAISVRMPRTLLSVLSEILDWPFVSSWFFPSKAPLEYRANADGTPLGAYAALFQSISAIENHGIAQGSVPTLVVVDPEDELVSASGLKELIAKRGLHGWKMESIHARIAEGTTYHHQIFDAQVLGEEGWKKLSELMRAHFTVR